MNSTKLVWFLAFIAICCFIGVQSLSCYTCSSESDCKKNQQKAVCSSYLANNTRSYLAQNYQGVNTTQTSTSFSCLSDYLKSNIGVQQYMGCVYSVTNACGFAPSAAHTNPQRTCKQCNNKDYCNSAVGPTLNMWNLVSAIVVVVIAKFCII